MSLWQIEINFILFCGIYFLQKFYKCLCVVLFVIYEINCLLDYKFYIYILVFFVFKGRFNKIYEIKVNYVFIINKLKCILRQKIWFFLRKGFLVLGEVVMWRGKIMEDLNGLCFIYYCMFGKGLFK